MLVLSRKLGEEVVIGDNIRITVVAIHGNRVRLGITAPVSIPVRREEVSCHSDRRAAAVPTGQPVALS
jgi:carbon storage regulator